MSATYQYVTIGSVDYPVYADEAYADQYLAADPNGDIWQAALDIVKQRALVNATRVLNLQKWAGSKTYPEDELAWPRTGVTTPAGAVPSDIIPLDIVNASCELANQVVNGVDIANFVSTIQTQRSIKAGSVAIENFRMTASEYPAYPLPQPAWLLIAPYMGSTGFGASISSFGTDKCSILDDDLGHSLGF